MQSLFYFLDIDKNVYPCLTQQLHMLNCKWKLTKSTKSYKNINTVAELSKGRTPASCAEGLGLNRGWGAA